MKKRFFVFLIATMFFTTIGTACAKNDYTTEVVSAIKLYKDKNFTECYAKLTEYIETDTANALAFYYLAMTATQIGKEDEALAYYTKAINLSPANSNLASYAKKGKLCIETPDACVNESYDSSLDNFIKNNFSTFSDTANAEFEKLKIEEMMRKMNRMEDIKKDSYKEFKDFSSMNNTTPTNDEIVSALRTLQRAGLANFAYNQNSDLSLLTGGNNNQNALINMMGGSSVNPQLLQTLLTNNMSLGF